MPDAAAQEAARRSRQWLRERGPRPGSATVTDFESALGSLALRDGRPVRVGPDRPLALLLQTVAVHADRAVEGGLPLSGLRTALARAAGDAEPFTATAFHAALALFEAPGGDHATVRRAVRQIVAAQREDGSVNGSPLTTALALLALQAAAAGSPAWRRARACLLRTQRQDGSWAPSPLDVRATAVMVLAFRGLPEFDAGALPRGLAWLSARRGEDGGWPADAGGPTDPWSTALVLAALDASGTAASLIGLPDQGLGGQGGAVPTAASPAGAGMRLAALLRDPAATEDEVLPLIGRLLDSQGADGRWGGTLAVATAGRALPTHCRMHTQAAVVWGLRSAPTGMTGYAGPWPGSSSRSSSVNSVSIEGTSAMSR
ncbi:hypothetical protein ACWCXB_19525 [Streptomyces sp. NPDC001514]